MRVGTKEFRITKVQRHPEEGYWTARVGSVSFDRKYGSWQVTVKDERREAMPQVAAALQDVVRRLERGERLSESESVSIIERRQPRPAPVESLDGSMGPAEIATARLKREKVGQV
jgi:hypothetical protein